MTRIENFDSFVDQNARLFYIFSLKAKFFKNFDLNRDLSKIMTKIKIFEKFHEMELLRQFW